MQFIWLIVGLGVAVIGGLLASALYGRYMKKRNDTPEDGWITMQGPNGNETWVEYTQRDETTFIIDDGTEKFVVHAPDGINPGDVVHVVVPDLDAKP